jgi:hypothetical protein
MVAAHRQATEARYALQADLIASLSAAQFIRDGKTTQALGRIEDHCYATALQLAGRTENSPALSAVLSELRSYRSNYAADPHGWSPVERRLEQFFATARERPPGSPGGP